MDKQPTKTNISFQHHRYIKEGEKNFRHQRFERALANFKEFAEVNPRGEAFVAGRVALTLMKLKRFKDAMKFLKKSIKATPAKERDYIWLYAECLYALDYVKESEKLCRDIQKKYPEMSWDSMNLLKKVSIHPHLDVVMVPYDGNERLERDKMKAFEEIIKILISQREFEEAHQYAVNLMNNPRNISALPYKFIADYYLRVKAHSSCDELLRHVEGSSLPEKEKADAFKHVLAIFKLSPDFERSRYKTKNPFGKLFSKLFEKADYAISTIRFTYQPVLNLDYYFDHEPQLVQA